MMFLRIIINNIKNVRYIEALQALYTRTAFSFYVLYANLLCIRIGDSLIYTTCVCIFLIRNGVPR